MIFKHAQTNITVLHHLSLGNILQSVHILLTKEEWKHLLPQFKKKYIKRIVVFCGLIFTSLAHSQAVQRTIVEASDKPMMLYFRFDKSQVDSEYMDNGRMLRHLDELLTDRNLYPRIDSINIYSFTSPEGNPLYNKQLSHQRSATVKDYLIGKYPHIDQDCIYLRPQGENWQELRQLIVDGKNIPNKEDVLQIIDCNKDAERCKVLLKELDNGVPYRYIYNHLLRYLRNAAICVISLKPDSLPALSEVARLHCDSLNKESYPIPQFTNEATAPLKEKNILPSESLENTKRPLFALKTNLLFDAALMPNVEIEVPIGKRWSINGEYLFPWWLMKENRYCLQILSGGLEGRYWLGSSLNRKHREVLTGHFVGLYAGGGKYDLQWKENGYQGEFFIASGISYGWATHIARNLHLEMSIGLGLLRTDYRHYHVRNHYQTLLWQENGKYTWFGPTKAKISLVWLLNRKEKKGGMR